MTDDQYTRQNPREQHPQPAPDSGEQLPHPGLTVEKAEQLALAREGADVLISYLAEEDADAQETAELVRKAGRTVVTVPGDIR